MIEKMIDMDVEVTEEQLTQMIAQRYEGIKYKKTGRIKEIQQIFKKHIEKYEENNIKKLNNKIFLLFFKSITSKLNII